MTNKTIKPLKPDTSSAKPFIAKTERGKKFTAIRAEIVAAGVPLLDRECLAREISERRGERQEALERLRSARNQMSPLQDSIREMIEDSRHR